MVLLCDCHCGHDHYKLDDYQLINTMELRITMHLHVMFETAHAGRPKRKKRQRHSVS